MLLFVHWENVLSTALSCKTLVMTSSLLSLLDCHDINDSNSATTLRLCSYSLFFCQLGQDVVYPVYVNCCHIKKSHRNSKRHNKLIFVKLLDLCEFIYRLLFLEKGTPFRPEWVHYQTLSVDGALEPRQRCTEGTEQVPLGHRAVGADGNKSQPPAEQGHQIKLC